MTSNSKLHVVVFPWLAFGHMIPFLELSKRIARKGHNVSFVSTPNNVERLPKQPINSPSQINFVKLSLPCTSGLPENAEATTDLPFDKVHLLKKAFDGLRVELTHFLESCSPDWIIYDFAPYWLPPIAKGLGISCAFFNAVNSWFLAFLGSASALVDGADPRKTLEDFTVPPKWVPFETNLAHRYYEIKWIAEGAKSITSDVLDTYRLGSAIIGCDILATRDCWEFENAWLTLLESLNKRAVVPVGLMPPPLEDKIEDSDETWITIKAWLDKHEKDSVIYVALGSELQPNKETLTELALGLELSGSPFFWALRESGGYPDLLNDFIERTKGCGVVWTGWAPQLKILSHDAIGGFLTHCGWSSIIEGLQFGRPLIMLPFMVEQGLNARIFEKHAAGIEIPRDEREGSLSRKSVADSVKLVMTSQKGKTYKEKAMEIKALFGDTKLHDQYLDDFVEHLHTHTRQQKS